MAPAESFGRAMEIDPSAAAAELERGLNPLGARVPGDASPGLN